MAGGVYDTATLLQVMSHQKVITPFWLQFFPQQINFDTEEIAFDRVSRDYRSLAPFVVPTVPGVGKKLTGYDTLSFRPAYVKPKDVVRPDMTIARMPGEALGSGSLSREQRRDAVIAELTRQHRAMLTNRNEWLAARALIDGAVTISGERYPARTVDFRRHSSLTYTLTGGARWSQGTAAPLTNLRDARVNSNNRSGSRIRRHVFGGNAWELFAARVPLKDFMDRNFGGFDANVQRMRDGYEGVEFMGYLSGSYGGGYMECWVDTSKFVDEAGAEQFFLDQNAVVGVGDIRGHRCFGAIEDKGALRAMEVFPKMWEEEDPSVEYIMSQSAPLMVPGMPNASFKIVVD